MLFRAIGRGFGRAFKARWAVFWLFLALWIPATLAVAPLTSVLEGVFEGTMAADTLADGGLSTAMLVDVLINHRKEIGAALAGLAPILLVGWWVAFFLSGGVFSVVSHPVGYTGERFWSGAARNFPRFLRLLLWSLILVAVIGILVKAPSWILDLVTDGDPGRDQLQTETLVSGSLLVAGLLFYRTVLDYARVAIVRFGERRTRVALWAGFKFTLRRLPITLGYLLAMLLIAGLVGSLTLGLRGAIDSKTSVVLLTLVGQLYVVWRAVWRVARYGGSAWIYEQLVEGPGSPGRAISPTPRRLESPRTPLVATPSAPVPWPGATASPAATPMPDVDNPLASPHQRTPPEEG
ncbi:MAG: hypothetical protein K8J08_05930 [Thermoanaerobaculia bacterium]|nr:hypothetical protein [Thermoanaerobaculia bacterium]